MRYKNTKINNIMTVWKFYCNLEDEDGEFKTLDSFVGSKVKHNQSDNIYTITHYHKNLCE